MIKVIKEFTLKIIYRQEEPSATAMDISTGHMVTHSVKAMLLMTMLIMVTLKVLSYKDTWSTIIIVVIISINIMMMNITKVLSYMEDHLKNKQRLEQEWVGLCAYEAEPNSTAIAFKVSVILMMAMMMMKMNLIMMVTVVVEVVECAHEAEPNSGAAIAFKDMMGDVCDG